MSYKFDPFSRRAFIQGIGGLVACPILTSLIPEKALAASAAKKRFVAISTPNQLPVAASHPLGLDKVIPADLTSIVTSATDGLYPYRATPLSGIAAARGQVSNFLDSKYSSYLSKISMIRGLDMPGRTDHGRSAILGNVAGSHLGSGRGYAAMRTMDEFLAASANFYTNGKSSVRYPILRMGECPLSTISIEGTNGVGINGNNSSLNYSGNLKTIFDMAFDPASYGAAKVPIVDKLLASVNRIKAAGKIGASDKRLLDQYMEQMSSLQNTLTNLGSPPPKPVASFLDLSASNEFALLPDGVNLTKNYYSDAAKLIALLIQTGQTQIATVGVSSSLVNPTLAVNQGGDPRLWHLKYAHGINDDGSYMNSTDQNNYLCALHKFILDNLFLELVKALDTPESGATTYLDNTLIYFISELGGRGHSGINYNTILAGNTSGGLKHGKHYDFSDWSNGSASATLAPGQPINRLWVGMIQSLGLTEADYKNKFGNGSNTFGIWQDSYPTGTENEFGNVYRGGKVGSPLGGLFG